MKYTVKIYKKRGNILVENFICMDTAERWAINALANGYVVLPIMEIAS